LQKMFDLKHSTFRLEVAKLLEWRNLIQTYGKPEISRLHFVPLEMTI